MSIITAIAGSSAGYIFAPVAKQLGYLFSYESNVDKLKTSVRSLTHERDCKQSIVEGAEREGDEIIPAVQDWLKEAEGAISDANRLIGEDNEGRGEVRCLNWPFPSLCLRHKLSMEAENMAQRVSELVDEGRPHQTVSYRPRPQMTTSASARGYEALFSRTSMLDEIKKALKEPNIYTVGVYGMAGVGKSTLVKEIARQAEEEGSFGVVVMATVTGTPDLRRIQGELADGLHLKLDKETENGRAGQLRGRIRKEKSILVILDDIWGELDLTDFGVPCGDEHKGCKLVLTSRDRDVLKSKMDTQKEFDLEFLSEEESWNLFEKMAANVVKHDRIKPIALEVTKCCSGLPLLIVTVAKALGKKEDIRSWQDSLKRLKKFDPADFHKSVYEKLEFSYNCLEREELKSLFLLIGSFEDVFNTEELIPICWGLGLYKDVDTLTEARNRHYTLVKALRDSSLLLEGEMRRVGMHDLVRDVAKSIASRTHPTYAVQRFTNINEWPKIDQLQKYHHIILPSYRVSELPENLECPELKLLVLRHDKWWDRLKVPDDFFSGIKRVKVLDLHGMKFAKPPPPSLGLLAKLRVLKLHGEFEDIAIVGKLMSLEILKLEDWEIEELPKEIVHLTRLRMLDFSECRRIRLIPKNLLSSLTRLEELYMADCPIEWEVEGSNNASLGELKNLHQLTTLELMIKDGSILPRDLHHFAKNLERYNISIGSAQGPRGGRQLSRSLEVRGASIEYILRNDGVKVLLTRVEVLELDRADLNCVRDILPGLNRNGFTELRKLVITYSAGLLHIINSDCNQLHHAFPKLETLFLAKLSDMKEICHGPLPTRSFGMLKSITVSNCNKLKNLLLWSHVRHLPQLCMMDISECQSIKEIIAEETHEIENIVLPKLQDLQLVSLPNLLSFCPVPSTVDMGSVPLALIDEKVAMPNLKTMELSGINTCKIWDGNLSTHSCIQNLTELTVEECGSLTSLFPSSLARALTKLQKLEFRSCQSLEEIFVQEENLENHHSSSEQVILPNLETLPNSFCKLNEIQISNCESMKEIIAKEIHEIENIVLPELHHLSLVNLPKLLSFCSVPSTIDMRFIPLVDEKVAMPNLKTMELFGINTCKIWDSNLSAHSCIQNLTELTVGKCDSLTSLFPSSVARALTKLQFLEISSCKNLEEIFVQEENLENHHSSLNLPSSEQVILPNLKTLRIDYMDNLKSLWCNQLAPNSFYKLNEMQITGCPKLLNVLPSSVLSYLINLETLEVIDCDELGVIFEIQELSTVATSQQGLATRLRKLKLGRLPNLKYIWSKDPHGILMFQNLCTVEVWRCESLDHVIPISVAEELQQLKVLKIWDHGTENIVEKSDTGELKRVYIEKLGLFDCDRLKTIVPSSVVFHTLDVLHLARCNGVENIMTSSTATSLPKLRLLKISRCDMIKEIVESENDGDAPSEIAFMKLEELELHHLQSLNCFCKGSYSFKFPLLQTVGVQGCPMMETFCNGNLTTPSLTMVATSWSYSDTSYSEEEEEEEEEGVEDHCGISIEKGRWDGDLNTTIGNIFAEEISEQGLNQSSSESEDEGGHSSLP